MTDDPLKILREAGIECPEVGRFRRRTEGMRTHGMRTEAVVTSDAAILALAKLAAKYKNDADCRDFVIQGLFDEVNHNGRLITANLVVDLMMRWKARDE